MNDEEIVASNVTITETKSDDYGTYTQVWHCDPPAEGDTFYVTKEHWDGLPGSPIRHIHAVQIVPRETA